MSYSELIKSLNPIRRYVRDFFVLGFKSRGDYGEKSGRSYDNERRRIDSWLSPYMAFRQTGKKKYGFLSVGSREETENPLQRVFCAKSFTTKDLLLHFFLTDLLAGGAALSVPEMWQRLSEIYPADADGNIPDESTIRKKCGEYEKLGVFRKQKSGRRTTYALSLPLPLAGAADALTLAAEIEPAGVLGFFLHRKTETAALPIGFKHRYLFQVLDADIAYTLLSAIREKRRVTVSTEKGEKQTILPAKLFISRETGREYVFCAETDRLHFLRLDRIESAVAGDIVRTPSADVDAWLPRLWGVSARTQKIYHVKMAVRVGPDESFIVRRLYREKRGGTLRQAKEGLWIFEADVCDPLEMIPWIRTYIGRIESLTSDHPYLVKRFRRDLAAMLETP